MALKAFCLLGFRPSSGSQSASNKQEKLQEILQKLQNQRLKHLKQSFKHLKTMGKEHLQNPFKPTKRENTFARPLSSFAPPIARSVAVPCRAVRGHSSRRKPSPPGEKRALAKVGGLRLRWVLRWFSVVLWILWWIFDIFLFNGLVSVILWIFDFFVFKCGLCMFLLH